MLEPVDAQRREREAALARAKHLDQLAGKEPVLWEKAEGLIAIKPPKKRRSTCYESEANNVGPWPGINTPSPGQV